MEVLIFASSQLVAFLGGIAMLRYCLSAACEQDLQQRFAPSKVSRFDYHYKVTMPRVAGAVVGGLLIILPPGILICVAFAS